MMLPPFNFTICLTILMPMPLPPRLVVKKGMKIFSRFAALIPQPLSVTEIAVVAPESSPRSPMTVAIEGKYLDVVEALAEGGADLH